MTIIEVEDCSCGFHSKITISMDEPENVKVNISSGCDAANFWGRGLQRINWRECFGPEPLKSELWLSAMEKLNHRSCPLPIAVLRGIECVIGINVPANINIRFIQNDNKHE